MKRIIGLFLVSLSFLSLVFAETIVLKSGETVEGKKIEQTDNYIKIDFYGVPLTYFLDDIESIDGKKVMPPSEQVIQRQDYSHEEPESEISNEAEDSFKAEKNKVSEKSDLPFTSAITS